MAQNRSTNGTCATVQSKVSGMQLTFLAMQTSNMFGPLVNAIVWS